MDPKTLHDLKLAVAVAVFVATGLQMLSARFGPRVITDNSRPLVPGWVGTTAAWLTLVASGAMVALEMLTPIA